MKRAARLWMMIALLITPVYAWAEGVSPLDCASSFFPSNVRSTNDGSILIAGCEGPLPVLIKVNTNGEIVDRIEDTNARGLYRDATQMNDGSILTVSSRPDFTWAIERHTDDGVSVIV